MESHPLLSPAPSRSYFSSILSFIYKYHFIIASLFFIILDITTTIISKRLIDYAANYTFFLRQLFSFSFVILLLITYLIFIFFFSSYVETKVCFPVLFKLCLFDSISGTLYTIGATFTLGPTIIILSQVTLPMTMLVSLIIRKKKYHVLHYIGTLLIASSVFFTQFFLSKTTHGNKLFFNILLVISCLIDSVSICYKEEQYAVPQMNLVGYEFWFSFILFFSNFLTLPIYTLKFFYPVHIDLSNYFTTMIAAFNCIIRGKNTIVENCGGNGQPSCDNCGGSPRILVIYFILAILIRLTFILLMRKGSALEVNIISILKMPLASIAFTFKFIAGNSRTSLQIKDILTIIFIVLGIIIYQIGTKKQNNASMLNEDPERSESLPDQLIADQVVGIKTFSDSYTLLEH